MRPQEAPNRGHATRHGESGARASVVAKVKKVCSFFFVSGPLRGSPRMDEIKRLQEELQRAQQSGSLARLSERNCIQVGRRQWLNGLFFSSSSTRSVLAPVLDVVVALLIHII